MRYICSQSGKIRAGDGYGGQVWLLPNNLPQDFPRNYPVHRSPAAVFVSFKTDKTPTNLETNGKCLPHPVWFTVLVKLAISDVCGLSLWHGVVRRSDTSA